MGQVKISPRQLNGTYILYSGSNASVRIKIGVILMEFWHFEGKRAHFLGDEVNTNVRGLLK
jgi:hypothetical protein